MGVHPNIGFDKFPKQSIDLFAPVEVCFNYDTSQTKLGIIIRDDLEDPFETIIQLEGGQIIRANECQYSFK